MTLPKNITDAIDNFEGKSLDHWMHDHYGTDRATFDAKRQLVTDARAALEAAIAAAIQPVEPPTDAEVEAWAEQFKDHCQPEGFAEDGKWVRSDSDQAHSRYERVLDSGLALMRRARSTEKAIDQAIADRGVPERDCRLPIAERVSNIISELKEWRHDYGVAAMNLERSEAARRVITDAKDFPTMAAAGFGLQVLKWIDEERGAGR